MWLKLQIEKFAISNLVDVSIVDAAAAADKSDGAKMNGEFQARS